MGIDPGTNFMGYAIIRTLGKTTKTQLVVSECWTLTKSPTPILSCNAFSDVPSRSLTVITRMNSRLKPNFSARMCNPC